SAHIAAIGVLDGQRQKEDRLLWLCCLQLFESPERHLSHAGFQRHERVVLPRYLTFREDHQFFLPFDYEAPGRLERFPVAGAPHDGVYAEMLKPPAAHAVVPIEYFPGSQEVEVFAYRSRDSEH